MLFGSVCVLLSGVLYGLTPLVTMILYADGINTPTVLFYRFLFVIPVILIISAFKKRDFKISCSDYVKIASQVALMSFVTNILLAGSYNYIATGEATTLHFLYPLVVILISVFYYREHLSKRLLLACVLVLSGLLCFMGKIDNDGFLGVVMASLSSLSYALYILRLERTRLNRLDPAVLSFYISLTIAFFLLLASPFIGSISFQLTLKEFVLFVLLGSMTFGALALFQLGSRYLGSRLCALLSLSEPLTSMVVGILFLGESLLLSKVIGAMAIMAAIIIVTLRKSKF